MHRDATIWIIFLFQIGESTPRRHIMRSSDLNSRAFLFFLAVCLLIPAVGLSAWSTDPAINNPVYTGGTSTPWYYRNNVTPDGAGGVIVAWQSPDAQTIYAQRLDADGNRLWSPANGKPVVATAPDSLLGFEAVITDQNGGAFIVYERYAGFLAQEDIYAQRIDANGNPLWAGSGMPVCEADSNQYVADVATADNPYLFVLFYDQRTPTIFPDLYFQWLDGDGSPQFVTDGIPVCTAPSDQIHASMTVVGDSGVVAVWEDWRYEAPLGLVRVYAQRIMPSGTMWTANGVGINSNSIYQSAPRVVSNGDNFAIVVWEAYASETSENTIFAQKLEPISGIPIWNPTGVMVTDSSYYCLHHAVAADGQGGAYIGWQDNRDTQSDLYAQRLDAGGSEMWTHFGVPVQSSGYCASSPWTNVIPSYNGDAIFAWVDNRAGIGDIYKDIYAQRIGSDGVPRWAVDGIPVCTASGQQSVLQTVSDGSGGFISVWLDRRNLGLYDIYAQQVGWTGALGVATGIGDRPALVPSNLQLGQNSPNPFGETTRFDFTLPAESDVRVDVYNIAGQRMATYYRPRMTAGPQEFNLPSRDNRGRLLPSGVYFYRVTAGHMTESKKMVIIR
jgi:hypothetical protein